MMFEQGPSKLKIFSNFEDFEKYVTKISLKSNLSIKGDSCSLCLQEIKKGVLISRKCQCELHPCEKFQCTQNQLPCCFHCMLQHLWNSSQGKNLGRFRAKCPFCQSEFCYFDLILLL